VSRINVTTFERCALLSGLLTQAQLDEGRAALKASGPASANTAAANAAPADTATSDASEGRMLADRLVQMGTLNPWQAKQLLDGRTKFTLGPYRVVDSLGSGGMGQVFKAEHGFLGRVVAIKVLPLSKATPESRANFTREIRAQARLDHINLVRALDADEDNNVYYLVTEYVPGCDLRKLVRRNGPLSMQDAASIISQVAAGLQHAHQQGLIHRDVKPGNVLVTPEGHAKLSDLGLAGPLAGGDETDPRHGKIVGTADYLSPDHIKAPWEPTAAWDIYSLGCTLYYAVTGKVPFPHGTTAEKARAHCELLPLDPRRLNPTLEASFVETLEDMMAKDPAERISSAAEVIQRLAPWTGSPRPVSPAEDSGKRRRGVAWSCTSPPVGPSDSTDPDETQLKDTTPNFPEFSSTASRVQGDRWARPSGVAGSRELPPMDADPEPDPEPSPLSLIDCLRPLLVLVGIPLVLLGLLSLFWWLFVR
jgi:serine/threonine protein kinase